MFNNCYTTCIYLYINQIIAFESLCWLLIEGALHSLIVLLNNSNSADLFRFLCFSISIFLPIMLRIKVDKLNGLLRDAAGREVT